MVTHSHCRDSIGSIDSCSSSCPTLRLVRWHGTARRRHSRTPCNRASARGSAAALRTRCTESPRGLSQTRPSDAPCAAKPTTFRARATKTLEQVVCETYLAHKPVATIDSTSRRRHARLNVAVCATDMRTLAASRSGSPSGKWVSCCSDTMPLFIIAPTANKRNIKAKSQTQPVVREGRVTYGKIGGSCE